MHLQHNKVTNLAIAIKRIDGVIIRPCETFSFCKLVGLPTKGKGYLPGMELFFGDARPGIGGGICQISNLIHWLVIHSPLTVEERHHHSFDPFPDDGRVLPFGSGATVFYNYLDYQFTNNTPYTFQIRLWITEKCLDGEMRIDQDLDFAYHVFEKDHQFLKIGEKFFRKNEIWRNKIIKRKSGEVLETELLTQNFAEVKYVPESYIENMISRMKGPTAQQRIPRLKSHSNNKDFWTEAIVFSSKDDYLTKTQIKYLEVELYVLAKDAFRAKLDNSQAPTRPNISEVDRAEVNQFFDAIKVIMSSLGVGIFEPRIVDDSSTISLSKVYELKSKKALAKMTVIDNKYVVLKGSTAVLKDRPSSPAFIIKLRADLVDAGIMEDKGDGLYTFVQDASFNSPSYAAAAIVGGSANGRAMWMIEDKSLKDIEYEELEGVHD